MLPHLVVSLCLAAPGLKSTTPLDDVKALDARLPQLLVAGPQLTAVLASKPELKKMLAAMKLDAETEARFLASALDDQAPKAELPSRFDATSAVVTKPDSSGTHTVSFYDGASRLDLTLLRRADKTIVLTGAPSHASENDLVGDLLLRRSGDASERDVSYFVKTGGTWKAAPLPTVTQAQCLERLHAPALALAESQQRFFKAHGTFTRSIGALDYDGSKFTVVATVKAGNATSFLAQVSMFGGVVTIDQTGKPVDVTPCTLAP